MNGTASRIPWWRERWVTVAGVIAVIQFIAFWFVSPPTQGGRSVRPPITHAFMDSELPPVAMREWLTLLSPSVLLMPSTHDFSGRAWLDDQPAELAFEDIAVASHPLPYQPIASAAAPAPLLPRRNPHPAVDWTVPDLLSSIPNAPPVPIARMGQVRIVTGLDGWQIPDSIIVPAPAGDTPPGSTFCRVLVDAHGNVAAPPLLWRSSGNPAADHAALDLIARLKLTPSAATRPAAASGDSWAPGILEVAWGIPPLPVPNEP